MPTVSVALDQTQYVRINTALNPMVLEAHRDTVRVTISELKPALNNTVYHELSGADAPLKFDSIDTNVWALAMSDRSSLIVSETSPSPTSVVSVDNSTTTLLTNGSVFTGEWENVAAYDSVLVAVKTDQNGFFTVQFSPDGVNQDSTLTRYYRTSQIEAPHRFTIGRKYCRVVFTNDSGSDQTFIRLQTMFGSKTELNAPVDSTLPQDFDALATRPTHYHYEVALGRRQGAQTWNKFGHNNDVDIGTEVIAEFGGTFTPLVVASTLRFVSTDVADANGGTGANSLVVYGVDANYQEAIEVVTLNGTTNVDTVSTWLAINRVSIYLAGSALGNVGTITVTAITGGTTQASIPPNHGTTQQCIFTIPESHQFLADFVKVNTLKQAGGAAPKVNIIGWVFSSVSNAKYQVLHEDIDTAVENTFILNPNQPFVIGEKSTFWLEATTDKVDTSVNARFSGVLIRDADSIGD